MYTIENLQVQSIYISHQFNQVLFFGCCCRRRGTEGSTRIVDTRGLTVWARWVIVAGTPTERTTEARMTEKELSIGTDGHHADDRSDESDESGAIHCRCEFVREVFRNGVQATFIPTFMPSFFYRSIERDKQFLLITQPQLVFL